MFYAELYSQDTMHISNTVHVYDISGSTMDALRFMEVIGRLVLKYLDFLETLQPTLGGGY